MNLEKIDEYIEQMIDDLKEPSTILNDAYLSLKSKMVLKRKRFSNEETFIFEKVFKLLSLTPKDKEYLSSTSLLKESNENDIKEKAFKHKGVIYYTPLLNNVDTHLVNNFQDYENNENMSDFSIFNKIARNIQKETPNTFLTSGLSGEYFVSNDFFIDEITKNKYKNNYFVFAFELGTSEGGSYTGTEAEYEPSGIHKSKNDFPQFLDFFEQVSPDITYIQAERLKRNLEESISVKDIKDKKDYYGNYTEYRVFALKIKELFNEMNRIGINLTLGEENKQKNRTRRRL